VISDSDSQPSADEMKGEAPELSPRAAALKARAGNNIAVCLADRTLEWDLAAAGNTPTMLEALAQVKPVTGLALSATIKDLTTEEQAQAILDKVSDVKGRFAQELAELFTDTTVEIQVPDYLRTAIEWVTEEPAPETPSTE
jgi:putative ATP-dependent endonuclease of OLD family